MKTSTISIRIKMKKYEALELPNESQMASKAINFSLFMARMKFK